MNRALEISEKLGDNLQTLLVLSAIFHYYISLAEVEKCYEISQRLIDLGNDFEKIPFKKVAHFSIGCFTLFTAGKLLLANEHAEKLEQLYKPEQRQHLIKFFGQDIGVLTLAFQADVLWYLGYVDQARARAEGIFIIVKELKHPFTLGVNSVILTICRQCSGDLQATQKIISYTLPIMIEQGFFGVLVRCIVQGWLLVKQGQTEEGLKLLAQGQENYEMTQEKNMRCYLWGVSRCISSCWPF